VTRADGAAEVVDRGAEFLQQGRETLGSKTLVIADGCHQTAEVWPQAVV
jgi:hypothetical protein